jgi:hypothetical protein
MKSYDEETIELFNLSIIEDEFDDKLQNNDIYDGFVSGGKELERLISTKDIMTDKSPDELHVLNVGAGQADLKVIFPPNSLIINLEPCPQRVTENTIEGWCEAVPEDLVLQDVVICWGVLCFVRSLPETLINFNRVLFRGGYLIVDVVTFSTMPLPQTVHPDSFIRYVRLFGFELEERINFGPEYHQRVGYRFKLVEEFNYKRLRMPQCGEKINNYLPERDWFMR